MAPLVILRLVNTKEDAYFTYGLAAFLHLVVIEHFIYTLQDFETSFRRVDLSLLLLTKLSGSDWCGWIFEGSLQLSGFPIL